MKAPQANRGRGRERGRGRKAESRADAAETNEDAHDVQERLLAQLAEGAEICRRIETQLGGSPAPELETIVKLHRTLVLRWSAEPQPNPQMLNLAASLMKPILEWARLQEKRKTRELAEQKYRDLTARDKNHDGRDKALRPETLDKIEHELRLF